MGDTMREGFDEACKEHGWHGTHEELEAWEIAFEQGLQLGMEQARAELAKTSEAAAEVVGNAYQDHHGTIEALTDMSDGTKLYTTPQPAAERAAPLDTTRDGHERPRAWRDVLAERRRQINEEGWTPEHDDEHASGEIAYAAVSYAIEAAHLSDGMKPDPTRGAPFAWPIDWDRSWWKPAPEPRRNLIKAGALILAEIERLDRAGIGQQAKGQDAAAIAQQRGSEGNDHG